MLGTQGAPVVSETFKRLGIADTTFAVGIRPTRFRVRGFFKFSRRACLRVQAERAGKEVTEGLLRLSGVNAKQREVNHLQVVNSGMKGESE